MTSLLVALAAFTLSAVLLVIVRNPWLDGLDVVVLVVALAFLARASIRLASDPAEQ